MSGSDKLSNLKTTIIEGHGRNRVCRIHKETCIFLIQFLTLLSIEKYESQILVIEKAEFIVRRYGPPEVCITAFLI